MIFVRRTRPPSLKNYQGYKKFLRIDFLYRCCYCGITERAWGSSRNFVVEHFKPKAQFPKLRTAYRNLYYACNRCNDFKGTHWPTPALRQRGFRFADPCKEDLYETHLREQPNGELVPLTACGAYTNEHIQLNRPELLVWRRERSELIKDILASQQLLKKVAMTNTTPATQKLISNHQALCQRLLLHYGLSN